MLIFALSTGEYGYVKPFDNLTQMQMYQEKTLETRSLPEIYGSLTNTQKEDLAYALVTARCTKTRQTIWNWCTGKTAPQSPLVRNEVAKCVGRIIGARVMPGTLFPD